MLDIRVIRTETERVKAALKRRKEVVDIDAILELDAKKRETLFAKIVSPTVYIKLCDTTILSLTPIFVNR